jgi:hypothetical protein
MKKDSCNLAGEKLGNKTDVKGKKDLNEINRNTRVEKDDIHENKLKFKCV